MRPRRLEGHWAEGRWAERRDLVGDGTAAGAVGVQAVAAGERRGLVGQHPVHEAGGRDAGAHTLENLLQLRASVRAEQVVWLLAGKNRAAREAVRRIAARHGDRLIDTRPFAGPDGLHPRGPGYGQPARIERAMEADVGQTEPLAGGQGWVSPRPAISRSPSTRIAPGHKAVQSPG